MMFHPIKMFNFDGITVIVPSISIGNIPQLAMDLLINNLKPEFAGHILHEHLVPMVGPNAFDVKSTQLASSCEVYYLSSKNIVFLQVRGAVVPGCEDLFSKALIEWMISFKAKKLITLTSVSAEVRKDKDLEGCQLRYVLPDDLREELEEKFISYGWQSYEDPRMEVSRPSTDSVECRLYVPGGGFGQCLYEYGKKLGLPTLALMIFAYEGDNRDEAIVMADALCSIIKVKRSTWDQPISWSNLYGNAPPPDIY